MSESGSLKGKRENLKDDEKGKHKRDERSRSLTFFRRNRADGDSRDIKEPVAKERREMTRENRTCTLGSHKSEYSQ